MPKLGDQLNCNGNEITNVPAPTLDDHATNKHYVDGRSSYRHMQNVPATTWTVVHGLGYRPGGVYAKDSAGTQWFGDVQHVDENTLTINFGTASFSGEAYIS